MRRSSGSRSFHSRPSHRSSFTRRGYSSSRRSYRGTRSRHMGYSIYGLNFANQFLSFLVIIAVIFILFIGAMAYNGINSLTSDEVHQISLEPQATALIQKTTFQKSMDVSLLSGTARAYFIDDKPIVANTIQRTLPSQQISLSKGSYEQFLFYLTADSLLHLQFTANFQSSLFISVYIFDNYKDVQSWINEGKTYSSVKTFSIIYDRIIDFQADKDSEYYIILDGETSIFTNSFTLDISYELYTYAIPNTEYIAVANNQIYQLTTNYILLYNPSATNNADIDLTIKSETGSGTTAIVIIIILFFVIAIWMKKKNIRKNHIPSSANLQSTKNVFPMKQTQKIQSSSSGFENKNKQSVSVQSIPPKYCNTCGSRVLSSDIFCAECGTKI